ncbi:hypothetical protein A5865_003426 [Enterococcus sp. 12E11_DIV0728]|nr:hypothetical protein A5865_003426 [Enterococcus sp. 12E11_DIV0728]
MGVANNKLTSIDVIANLPELRSLNAGNNEINDISNLLDIRKIKSADIRYNRVGDVDDLVKFIQHHGENSNMSGQQTAYFEPIKLKKRKNIEMPINYSFTAPKTELSVGGKYDPEKKITIITEKDLETDSSSRKTFHYYVRNTSLSQSTVSYTHLDVYKRQFINKWK